MTDTPANPPVQPVAHTAPVEYANAKTNEPQRASIGRYLLLSGIVAAIVLGVIATLTFLKYRSIQAAMAGGGWPEAPMSVLVTRATERDWQPVINTTGTVVATQFVTLQNEEAGTIKELNIKSGQVVEAGALVVRLDTSVEAAELRAAVAKQQLAELQLDRAKRSAASNAASANELDQAQATLDEAIAVNQELQARIDRKTLNAPFKATVGIVDWQIGQYLPEGSSIVALTGVDDYVFVDFAVPQQMAGRLPVGAPIELFRMDVPDQPFMSQIVSDDMTLSDRTRTTRTRAKAKNTAQMRPGMSVNVRLPASLPQRVITVPATSIRRAAWGDFVYVLTTDNEGKTRAQQRGITVGPSLGEQVIVRKGVDAGTDVVADGSFKLTENALVQVESAADAVASSPLPATQPVK